MHEDFLERRKEMARLSREGWTLAKIGEKFGITRQAVSQHLKKAAKEGNVVELNFYGCSSNRDSNIFYRPKKQPVYQCVICSKRYTGQKRKTCGSECLSQLMRKRTAINGKWSRYAHQSLVCAFCKKNFERSNYLSAIAEASGCENTYCSRRCFHNSCIKNK